MLRLANVVPAFPVGAGGASQVLRVGTFIVRRLEFLELLIKQRSERLRSSAGDRLKSSGFTGTPRRSRGERRSRLRECASVLRQELLRRLAPLATTSAGTFADQPGCKLVVPFPFFRWTLDPVFHTLAFVPGLIHLRIGTVRLCQTSPQECSRKETNARGTAPPTCTAVAAASFNKLRVPGRDRMIRLELLEHLECLSATRKMLIDA